MLKSNYTSCFCKKSDHNLNVTLIPIIRWSFTVYASIIGVLFETCHIFYLINSSNIVHTNTEVALLIYIDDVEILHSIYKVSYSNTSFTTILVIPKFPLLVYFFLKLCFTFWDKCHILISIMSVSLEQHHKGPVINYWGGGDIF